MSAGGVRVLRGLTASRAWWTSSPHKTPMPRPPGGGLATWVRGPGHQERLRDDHAPPLCTLSPPHHSHPRLAPFFIRGAWRRPPARWRGRLRADMVSRWRSQARGARSRAFMARVGTVAQRWWPRTSCAGCMECTGGLDSASRRGARRRLIGERRLARAHGRHCKATRRRPQLAARRWAVRSASRRTTNDGGLRSRHAPNSSAGHFLSKTCLA